MRLIPVVFSGISKPRVGEMMDQILNGFLFGIGLLPVLLLYKWASEKICDIAMGDAIDWEFDRKLILIHNVRVEVNKENVEVLGEVENLSDEDCGYIQLDCDLLDSNGDFLAHTIGVVSNLESKTRKGFSAYFEIDHKKIDSAELKHRVTVAQTMNLND